MERFCNVVLVSVFEQINLQRMVVEKDAIFIG